MEGVFIMRIVWDIKKIKTFVEYETDCKLISSEYIGYTVPMEFRCACGNEFKKTWNKFKSGGQRTCPECSVKRTAKKQRKTYKEFEKEQQEKKLIKQLKKEQKKKIKENKRKNGRAKK